MDLQHTYSVAEVLEIYHPMPSKDKEMIKTAILVEGENFENLVKKDFAKYEATFKALV